MESAELMASELGWDKDRMEKELEEVKKVFPSHVLSEEGLGKLNEAHRTT